MQLVENPGFHNGVFLQADNKVIGKIADGLCCPILDPTSKIGFPMVERKGKLAEWKSNIAVSALYSSRIMLTITAAFSSSLLKITDIESGGFHLYGASSTGKSTCQSAAQSVQGSQDSIESWSLTETGAEELAAGHNDQLLVLDELANLDSDPVKAAQKATKIIYTIAFGKDKRRSVNYTGERLNWRIIFISSGENSLTEHAAEGGTKRMLGEEVRLIDVPADAGNGLGIYERLPDNISPAQYADNLKLSCKNYYGTPQQAFLKKFIHQIAEDIDLVKNQIECSIKEFMDEHNVDGSKGYEARMAKRFALAYAGGKLAVKYGILPFDEKQVMSGISKCYVDTIKSRPKSDTELVQIACNTIDNELRKSSNFLDIRSCEHGFSIEQIEKARGYKSIVKGKEVRVIKSDVMEDLIPNNKIRKMALDSYVAEGRLVCDAGGNRKLQVKTNLKPMQVLSRAYCFLPKQKETEA